MSVTVGGGVDECDGGVVELMSVTVGVELMSVTLGVELMSVTVEVELMSVTVGGGVDERDGGVELISVTVGMTMMKQMMFVVTDRCE